MPQDDYSLASRKCDIIMKGGITSGIVYPKAVCRLAVEYRFRSIGGTSAGAIAAAATAAAEYGRLKGTGTSFHELA
ncbi:MAG TPA: patatin-like phospholipase family protein, partial [Vicinamibacteria bacterium]|nr:patatin-like phospholipase family protein [Vicinamibacteria bacterium]